MGIRVEHNINIDRLIGIISLVVSDVVDEVGGPSADYLAVGVPTHWLHLQAQLGLGAEHLGWYNRVIIVEVHELHCESP